MITVYKYPLWFIGDYCELEMPLAASIIHVGYGVQGGGDICVWALVDTKQVGTKKRVFRIACTGDQLDNTCRHLSSHKGKEGPFIWHIFEVYEKSVNTGQQTGVDE